MSGSSKEKLHTESGSEEATDDREVYLRDGRKLVVSESAGDQLVEIRNESGMLEVRIKLTAEGPVLQMEAVRLQLKATEAVEIEAARVDIKGTEHVEVSGGAVKLTAQEGIDVEAQGEVHVNGKMIYLN
jgi:phage gp45-like